MQELLNYVLNNLDKEINSEIQKKVKLYIMENKDDKEVQDFMNALIIKYQSIFLDPKLIEALNIPNNLQYLRLQKIYEALPGTRDNYVTNLFQILQMPSEYFGTLHNFYKGCKWLFQQYNFDNKINSILDILIYFTQNLKIVQNLDKYNTYEQEFNFYYQAVNGIYSKDFDTFLFNERCNHMYSLSEIQSRYIKKKLGNYGEAYTFELLKNLKNAIFTSNDYGDGFGFDIYYQNDINNITNEHLIEVKSTAYLEIDFFTLSENEYKVMIEASKKANVHYLISRIIYNINTNTTQCYALKYEDNKLRSINYEHDQIEYIVNEENMYQFVKKEDYPKLVKKHEA